MSYEEAVAAVTAPGQMFSIVETEVLGQPTKVYEHIFPTLRTLFDTARGRGDETFLVYEDERLSFTDVMAQVDAIAAMLVDHYGVSKGDRVAIGMRNYPEWITSFAAITSIGAVAVSLNAWWTVDEMAYGLEDSGTSVLIADQERAERAEGAFDTLGVRTIVVRSSGPLPPGAERLEDVLVPGAAMPAIDLDPDDDATILYTSGTTGHPKGAVSTHRAVLHGLFSFACRAAVNGLTSEPSEPHPFPTAFILIVPLFHVTGCVAVMLSCWLAGAKLVLMYKWGPERALELIERERITNFVGVPTMSWDLLESPDFATRDTSSLLAVGGGGAPAPPELVRRVESSFTRGRPQIGYGMTETNAYGPGNTGDDYVRKPSSTGRFVPPMDVKIAGAGGEALPAGEVGEICFAGPMLIRGYWNKPEATAETIKDGWLYSGDIGRIDAEGFVYVEDRAKDMVIRAGENIYCAEVEASIYDHPAVYECAVFGIPHERLGEELVVSVFLKEGMALTADELQAHVSERLAGFKVPTRVIFVDQQLPRGATGKILKRELRDDLVAEG
ncbi:MAG TPA: class I adenylate-forming enzyme family protein [Acidimicrobiales bacterium]